MVPLLFTDSRDEHTVHQLFEQLDTNGNGRLSWEELKAGFLPLDALNQVRVPEVSFGRNTVAGHAVSYGMDCYYVPVRS